MIHNLERKRWESRLPYLPSAKPGQEATVRMRHGTRHCFKIGKGICQSYILSPCLFNLHAEYITQNAGLDESQAGIKIARRNVSNLRYADASPLWQNVKRN